MQRKGMRFVWLECDDQAARARFLARGKVSEDAFDAQVASIRANYATIMETTSPTVVQVLNTDGPRVGSLLPRDSYGLSSVQPVRVTQVDSLLSSASLSRSSTSSGGASMRTPRR